MFMRFHGGGIGHRYMRRVEPWLDDTGWGATWPTVSNRVPDPDPIQHGDKSNNGQNTEDEDDGGSEVEDTELRGGEEEEGDDPEHPEEEDLDEDEDESGKADSQVHPNAGEDEDEDEETEVFPTGYVSL